ncbi:enolase C-terminal domain-like protein, partial [Escherichia coli]|uniref:enolase C-terminal domain-like protein n=1 Tax=Escherichia coli TaxID=562 RepID=UPI003EE071EA
DSNGKKEQVARIFNELFVQLQAAALHFDLWVPNFGVQEYMGYSEQMLEIFPHNWTFDNGYMHPGEKPGLGIEFDEELAAKYPYEPAYLPVARLEDGTLWNW